MKSVLIVEDEKMIRQGIKNMIQRSGVPTEVIIECNNGEAALEILKEKEIDVMFTDIRMPKMDGIELVREMQNLSYQPLTVVISGYDDFSYAVEMLRQGVKEYILKPVDRNQINEIMQKMETEVTRKKEAELVKKTISLQQLRYLCLEKKMDEKEKELLENQFKEQFQTKSYEVCCCNCKLEGEEQTSTCLYLGNVDKHQIFIVDCGNKGFLLQNELQNCYAGFSEPVQGIENLQSAYKHAVFMRKLAFSKGMKVMDFEANGQDVFDDATKLCQIHEKDIDAIVNMLGTDHVKDVVFILSNMIRDVQTQKVPMIYFENWIHLFLDKIVKNYANVLKVKEEDLLEIENMYQYQTITEYAQVLKEWIFQFYELISEEFDDYKNKKKIQQAIVYMQENYQKDLNMAVVSNHISMNYSLFSYAFKQYTGKNFVAYLKELRIDEAKRLLAESDWKVIEISQKVGYENEKHFMKTFKALCGVSPTEYRKSVGKL